MPNTIHVALQDSNATDVDFGGSLLGNATNLLITGATKAVNCQITCTGHGRKAGDWIWITAVGGMTQLNGIYHQINTVLDANNFTLNTDSTSYGTYTANGWVYAYATSKTNPCRVRKSNHKYRVGQQVYISGVSGMTELNNQYWTVTAVEGEDTFAINTDSTSYGVYSGTNSGYVKGFWKLVEGVTQANPAVVSVQDHGWVNGTRIYFDNVGGMTELNGKTYTLANVTTHTFELQGIDSTGFSAFTSGGEAHWMRATMAKANSEAFTGDIVKVEKTTAATTIAGGITFTWTHGLNTVSTSATTVGTISVDDLIGFSTSAGNGSPMTYYRVSTVTPTVITLRSRVYLGESTPSLIEAGCKRVVPVATGLSTQSICSTLVPVTIQGGYTFADNQASVRDAETWVRHAFADTISSNIGVYANAAGSIVRHLNVA